MSDKGLEQGDAENTTESQTTVSRTAEDTMQKQQSDLERKSSKGWRYGATITALCVTSCLVALEGRVVSVALPSILRDLGGGHAYLWVIKAYFLSSTAFTPLYGQSANCFGRRWLIIFAPASFMLGSGISGGASGIGMLIAGRTIQGVGGGGSMPIDLIISNLVPARERGFVMGYIFGAATICTALGPFIGGVFVQHATWRWVFYIDLPIAFVGLVLLVLFLKMEYEKSQTLGDMFKRVDLGGIAIFVAATIAILIALTNAGTLYAWCSCRIILLFCLGFVALIVFFMYEQTPLCRDPTLPTKLFGNRTSAAAFVLTFLHMMFLYWEVYVLPLYFQAVRQSSPTRSGVQLLPTVVNLILFAAIGGVLMEKLGRYREIHAVEFAFMA